MIAPAPAIVPSTLSAVVMMASVTWKRMLRTRLLWVEVALAALPIAYACIERAQRFDSKGEGLWITAQLLLAIMPAMFVGASIGEEFQSKTSTYLWSRPIARWAVIAGKLLALVPFVTLLLVGGWYLSVMLVTGSGPSVASCLALAVGCVAVSLVATGMAMIMPKHGMSLTIGYMIGNITIGALDFSLNHLSIIKQVSLLAGIDPQASGPLAPLIWIAIIAGLWTAVAVFRIRRLET